MLELNQIYQGNCFNLINELKDNSIDLMVTSPPYADTKSYGNKVNVFHPNNYADWILPIFDDLYRVLKPSGSAVFNIDDKCYKKLRHPYVFDLIMKVTKDTEMKLYDYYIWEKKSFLPNGGTKRVNHVTEWLLHFVKDENKVKWNMDNVREPYSESSIQRVKSSVNVYDTDENGVKSVKYRKKHNLSEKGKIPSNVFNFNTASDTQESSNHPAPFSKELPKWFIKALTDEGDTVLDIFMGSGTTAVAAEELNRNWIGFELNEEYINFAKEKVKKFQPKENQIKQEQENNDLIDTLFK